MRDVERRTNEDPLAHVPTSQKILGLKAARNYLPVPQFHAVAKGAGLNHYPSWEPAFVRPCPQVPVHGYIESRTMLWEEIEPFMAECRAQDPDVEFLVCKWIKARWNAILTPGRITLGPGHDGATSGKDAIEIPIRGEITNIGDLLREAHVTEAPYFEIVGDADGRMYCTQLRSGPRLPKERDYVPGPLVVSNVVSPIGEDLLEWAKRVAGFPPGTVVYHPGGSLASHYGVHCVLHNVPYVVSWKPVAGEELKPNGAPAKPNLEAVLSGIRASSLRASVSRFDSELLLPRILFALHESPWLVTTKLGCYLIGVGIDTAARCAMMAVLGERRHRLERRKPRELIYSDVWGDPARFMLKLAHSIRVFEAKGWRQGYGGASWATCARRTKNLVASLCAFVQKPSQERFKFLMEQLNDVVTAAHNNGKFLNKFGPTESFETAARGGLDYFWKAVQFCAEWGLSAAPCVEPSHWECLTRRVRAKARRDPKEAPYDGLTVQCIFRDEGNTVHFQIGRKGDYRVVNHWLGRFPEGFAEWLRHRPLVRSLADTERMYYELPVEDGKIVWAQGELQIE